MKLPNLTLVTLGLLAPVLERGTRQLHAAARRQREAARLMKEAAGRMRPDHDLR